MQKIIFILLMSCSVSCWAAVVEEESVPTRIPSVTHPDLSKRKVIVKDNELSHAVGSGAATKAMRYQGVATMDNAKAIENMSRLMQDNPEALMAKFTGGHTSDTLKVNRRAMGKDEIVGRYVKSPETDDPAEKFANLRVPELTGNFYETPQNKAELAAVYETAVKQMEQIGHKKLGEKQAPIRMAVTKEDFKEMGADMRRFPKDFDQLMAQQAQAMKEQRLNSYKKRQDSRAKDWKDPSEPKKSGAATRSQPQQKQ